MTIETREISEYKTLQDFLIENHKEELNEILAIGEKYGNEGEEMKNKFRKEHGREEFVDLTKGYKESEDRFIEGLEPEEKRIINSLNGIEKKKFLNEYLKDRILYSGDFKKKYEENKIKYDNGQYTGMEGLKERAKERKDRLQPGMEISLSWIGSEGVEVLAKERKNSLQPGMEINLGFNSIGSEGVAILAREWKDSLQPGMRINLRNNEIGSEGVEVLAKERKNGLQLGMEMDLDNNQIGSEGAEMIAKEWKDSLQPGMTINLDSNNIGDEGVGILAREWKDGLHPGMYIILTYNKIGDEGANEIMKLNLKEGVKIALYHNNISNNKKEEIKKWVQGYKDRGINCKVTLV